MSNKIDFTPKEIVEELNKYIVGQVEAKRAIAIALRNRYRRSKLPKTIQDDIIPKNILMIGPTGVGKTEIARRIAKLVNAPFIKVEATKYTEIGYVGRDVESMIRELLDVAIRIVKTEKTELVKEKAEINANERLIDLLLPHNKNQSHKNPLEALLGFNNEKNNQIREVDNPNVKENRIILEKKLHGKELEDTIVEIEIEEQTNALIDMFSGSGYEQMGINMQEMLTNLIPKKIKKRKLPIKEARKILIQEEANKLIDMDEVVQEGIRRTEQYGIIFIDEIDKIAGKGVGPDVSREGVQRDILPIIEGSTVVTKYGPVKTDHILFIAAGAFHISKPSDLIPELQGRFPIRVELKNLVAEDFIKILLEPKNSLIKQYKALLQTEGINLIFTDEAIIEIANIAFEVNTQTDNIGARRLHTILEKLLEDLLFEAPNNNLPEVTITPRFVQEKLSKIVKNHDLSQYIL